MKQTPRRKATRRMQHIEDAHRRDLARLKREVMHAVLVLTAQDEVVLGDEHGHELRVRMPRGSQVDISRVRFPCGNEIKQT